MNKFSLHASINSIILLLIIVFSALFYLKDDEKDLVYLDNLKLFNEFNMTQDIKVIEDKKIKSTAKELDSIYELLNNLKEKEGNLFKNLQQQIAHKSKIFQEQQDNYTINLTNNVWKRLSAYIKDYAEANNLKIIIGRTGNGNIMFADQSLDITSKVLEFSNRKYEGIN